MSEGAIAGAPSLFDVEAYVEDFGRSVVPAYRRGIADAELPADAGLARSVIPPGTAATRDFSRLAPQIPEFLLDKCVGCMACVAACPDSAILASVVPEPECRRLKARSPDSSRYAKRMLIPSALDRPGAGGVAGAWYRMKRLGAPGR